MRRIAYIELASAPENFEDFQAYKELFGYDDSYRFYGAFHKGQQVGYAAVKDNEIVHVSSVDPEVDQGLMSIMVAYGHTSAKKAKEPKDLINAPVPFIYDAHHKHIQIGYEGEKPRDIKPYRAEFSKGAIVEGEYQPGGKMVIWPSNSGLYTTNSILQTWLKQFPQMQITSVEFEVEGKKHKVAQWNQNYSNNSSIWDFQETTSSIDPIWPESSPSNPATPQLISVASKMPTKQSMAADPNWLNSWIAANGPYAYHTFSDPSIAEKISKEGLLPWDHPHNTSRSDYLGGPYEPRKNHVYLGVPDSYIDINGNPYMGLQYKNDYVARVDLRKLDPKRLNADEDSVHSLPVPFGLGTGTVTKDSPYQSYGEWADNNPQVSNHPLNVQRSVERNKAIAHEGPIPLDAIEVMPYNKVFPMLSRNVSKVSPKQSMAADPNWLNYWIQEHGPYAYHVFSDPDIGYSIFDKGLLPWDHPENPSGSIYGDDDMQPRPNHVYLGVPYMSQNPDGTSYKNLPYQGHYVARVDLRQLDPNNINADEDSFSKVPKFYSLFNKSLVRNSPYNSYGEWAEANKDITNHPLNTQRSIEMYHTLAHNGPIPRESMKIMPYADAFPIATKTASQMPPGDLIRVLVSANPAASKAYEALSFMGAKTYVVGGAVRDVLNGQTPKDIDMLVAGLPTEEVHNILEKLPGRVDLTGKRFGVYRYRHDGQEVEIALPRTDRYDASRRGQGAIEVDPHLPIEADLKRRDFTVNSMAVDLDNGELIDPYGGQNDLQAHILRASHKDAFREDPTRLVRALTAHSRFGLHPDEATRTEMASNAHLLRDESPDALNKVLDKLFGSDNPAAAIRLAHETGVLKHLFPEVDAHWDFDQRNPHHKHSLGEHLMHTLDNMAQETPDTDLRMAAMLHDIGKPASAWEDPQTHNLHFYESRLPDGRSIGADHARVGAQMASERLRQLNYPTTRINKINHIIEQHMFPRFDSQHGARKFLQRVGDDYADDMLTMALADGNGHGYGPEYWQNRTAIDTMRGHVDEVRKGQQATDLQNLAINGNDLLALGVPQGPKIGQILRNLLDHVVDVPTDNQPQKLIQLAKEYARV